MKLGQLIHGLATFLPGVNKYFTKGTGGTDSARYCYSVWLRHLVMAKNNGLNPYPEVVAELGPGDSLGIGLMALLTGSEKYLAFDIFEYANIERNLKIFKELVAILKHKADIPGDDEFPDVKPRLDNYAFPVDIFTDSKLKEALLDSRIEKIRNSIINPTEKNSMIKYKVPWFDSSVIDKESVDMIYSQAVLEHADDLENTYKAMRLWLKPNGFVSHQIDFRCHGTSNEWNGHWMYSDFTWKLIRGKRPYLLNRAPHSTHLQLLKKENHKIVCDTTVTQNSNIKKDRLNPRFRDLSNSDLTTSGAFIQAVKQ